MWAPHFSAGAGQEVEVGAVRVKTYLPLDVWLFPSTHLSIIHSYQLTSYYFTLGHPIHNLHISQCHTKNRHHSLPTECPSHTLSSLWGKSPEFQSHVFNHFMESCPLKSWHTIHWSLSGILPLRSPSSTALVLLPSWFLAILSAEPSAKIWAQPSATATSMLTSSNQHPHGKSHAIVALTHCQVSNSMGLTLVWHSHYLAKLILSLSYTQKHNII